MTDHELRALVRDAVQRHLGAGPAPLTAAYAPAALAAPALSATGPMHPSHALYITLVNTSESCVIESAVSCDHCGYCKSHGH